MADEDAFSNYNFWVEIDGIACAHFKEVTGLSAEIQVIEHKENTRGGIPVIHKLPGAKTWGNITLKTGKFKEQDFWQWIKQVQAGQIDKARRNCSIVLYDFELGEKARWNVHDAWPSKVSIAPLQSGGSEVLMEEIVLVHEGLEVA